MPKLNIGNLVRLDFTGFLEDFENGWFIDNPFTQLFTSDFETGWFIDNIFTLLFTEDFENGGW